MKVKKTLTVLPQDAMGCIASWGVMLGSFNITYGEIRRFASYLEEKGLTLGADLIFKRVEVLNPLWVSPLVQDFTEQVVETLTPYLGVDVRLRARNRVARERRLIAIVSLLEKRKGEISPLDDLFDHPEIISLYREKEELEKLEL